MTSYYFETREFGISDGGIHLLRSRFNYETIEFKEIDNLTIERGKELNNWVLIFTIGLALVSFSLYYSLRLFNIIDNNEANVIYIEQILIPLIPVMLGGYCLYSSTRNGTVLRIRTIKNKTDKFPLKELEKSNSLQAFQDLLKNKLSTKVRINA
ncbi:MAG: hypothetical protein ACOYXT_00130 [Bacteroidota bacterium]